MTHVANAVKITQNVQPNSKAPRMTAGKGRNLKFQLMFKRRPVRESMTECHTISVAFGPATTRNGTSSSLLQGEREQGETKPLSFADCCIAFAEF